MTRNLGFLVLAFLVLASICESAIFNPVSDSHRSAALDLFSPTDGTFRSLEETYKALRTFEVLGIEKKSDIRTSACASVVDTLRSTSSVLKDVFEALRVNGILKCELNDEAFGGIASRLKVSLSDANSLFDFYYSIGGLVLIKDQTSEIDLLIGDSHAIFRSIKALGQSDGRWRISSSNTDSSTSAAGIALETLAGVISLASSEVDQSLIATLINDVLRLFEGIERYDDGASYFDEKLVDASGHQGPLSASSSVVCGITAFAASTSESLNLPGEKILGLAKFFLGIGIPGSAKDLYYQIDALVCLENIRHVRVSTVLGSAPPLAVKLRQIFISGSKDASVIDQILKFDPDTAVHVLETLPANVDIGNHIFSFEIILEDAEDKKHYAIGGRTKVPVHVTGVIKFDDAEIAVLDSDLGNIETQKKYALHLSSCFTVWLFLDSLKPYVKLPPHTAPLGMEVGPAQACAVKVVVHDHSSIFTLCLFFDQRSSNQPETHSVVPGLELPGENAVSLSANHLQRLRLSFRLTTPFGHSFKPHQDFLGLVEKLFYLSGKYDIQLTVGDSVMENSFLQPLGHIELDLPDAPEKAAPPPPKHVDPYSRFGPKAEISHIFRSPEKRPPQELSLAFLGFVLLPLFGFLAGLFKIRANLNNMPKSTLPATFAFLFHSGIGSILLLYALFWFKLDLFTTLKALGLLGMFLMFVGHTTLSHLASTSTKLKSS
ncbi:hypothetical protein RD792_017963 [Penstemon davidsonii]|uniref:Dolichyl-diphosphooligosaccharide--protein glycosyltransferase subunit 2 n=1 Tax=Penstemon davidsonii TaxID=160366 RepID=A0ABR0DVC7_9LAMI|nr:hypothetical protein RD792_017963 [Penstemon davidsonii]